MAKVYTVRIRNRFTVIVFAIAFVGLVALVFTVGLAFLATIVVAGGLIGLGVGIFNRLRSGLHQLPSTHHDHVEPVLKQQLDPTLEVQPVRPAIVRPKIDIEV
jgi:hypothetical protein